MDRMDFTQGVVRTRVLEKRLLSKAHMERIIDAEDMEEVFRILKETEYANHIAKANGIYDYETVLSQELIRIYNLMREISVEQIVVDLLALKYDYHNLKVLIKEKELNKDLADLYLPIGVYDFNKIKAAFKEGNFTEIPQEYLNAINAVQKDFEQTGDPQRIDLIFDRCYYEHLYKKAVETNIDLFINYVRDMIDFINIKSSIRLKRQGKDIKFFEDVVLPNGTIDKDTILLTLNDSIESMIRKYENYRISPSLMTGLKAYEKTNRLTDLEKYIDDYLMNLNQESKYTIFGPEPIFSYIVAKETEIKNLRIIMVSKINHIAPELIRERVRDLYV